MGIVVDDGSIERGGWGQTSGARIKTVTSTVSTYDVKSSDLRKPDFCMS